MTLALAIVVFVLVAGVSVWFALWARNRAQAEAAQFQAVVLDAPNCSVIVLVAGVTPRFAHVGARALVECSKVWHSGVVMSALHGVRIVVDARTEWVDSLTGRTVGGTSRYGEIHVGSDLSALFHELAHRVIEVQHGVVDDAHVHFTAEVWAADERYRAAIKGAA